MKHAPWQYCNISYNSTNNAGDESQSCNIYNSTNYAGDELQSCNISCNNTNNIDYTIEKQWRLPHNNKYCFTITPTNYYGSGMQLNCKLLSCYCKQVWYFIGGCSLSQCENNNRDMSSRLPTWAIIVIVLAGIVLAGIVLAGIVIVVIIAICCYKKKNEDENKQEEKQEEEQEEEQKEEQEEKQEDEARF